MKLRTLELDQFKKFDRPIRIEGFGDGLNLLCGPNEMGKSTVMAALGAALFERHRAGGEHIKALQPLGHKAAPWVALDFDIDGEPYRIEKRFLRNEHARLVLPDGRRFDGTAAEEELQRLLGFAEPGNRGITPEQLGAWSVLWVGQGSSFAQPEIVERAQRSLEGSLSSEVGALLGTDDALTVRRASNDALRELIGAYERPRARYKQTLEQIDELTRELERLRQAKGRLAQESEQLQAEQRRLAELQDEREEARLLERREQARRRRDELRILQDRIRTAEAQFELATQEHKRVRDEIEQRARIAASIEQLGRRLGEATETEATKKQALERSEAEIERLELQRSALEEQRAAAVRTQDRLHRLAKLLRELEFLQHLRAQHQQVQEAVDQARTLRLRAESISLVEDQVEQLRSATRERESTEARLQAVATLVRFAIDAPALGRIQLNGAPLPRPTSEEQIIEPVTIEIAGVGTILIAPQIEGRERLLATRRAAERRLRELLAEAGVERLETAEAKLREKQKLLRDAEAAEHRVQVAANAALPGMDGADALRIEIERRSRSIESERAALQIERLPSGDEIDQQLGVIETEVVGLDQALREVAGLLEGARRGREQKLLEHGRGSEAARQARADLHGRRGELELAEREQPTAELEQAVAEVSARVEERRRELNDIQEAAADANLDLAESEFSRLEQAIERRRAEVGDLREKVAALRSGIEKDEGAGLEEQVEDATRRLALRELERASCEREIKALRLLVEVLDEAEQAAKQRYLRPVVNRLCPYVRGLFPGADVTVDESFRITALRRANTGDEPFEQLSDGTREQIAVLARLAFAEMIADQGLPAVVLLDDALAFSDDQRLDEIFNVLHHAARRLQIVVFTCRERLFESLGATRLQLADGAHSAAAAD